MNLLTMARRATLGPQIVSSRALASERLACARSYLESIASSVTLVPRELRFHLSMCLVGIVSIAEAYVQDSTQEFIVCHPGHIADKKLDIKQLVTHGSILHAVTDAAERTVRDFTYLAFPEMVAQCVAIFDSKSHISTELLENVNEIKCTRDLIVHNGACVNAIYLRKAGDKAREQLGKNVPVSYDYVRAASAELERFIGEFFDLGPARFADRGKAHAFRQMWEATCLATRVPFDAAWVIEAPNMIRPKYVDWPWSSSEKALYDFFLGIYSVHNPARTTDTIEVMRRWPPPCRESRVLASWLESPFGF